MWEGTQVRLVVPVQGALLDPMPALQAPSTALNAAAAPMPPPVRVRPAYRAQAASTNQHKAKRLV